MKINSPDTLLRLPQVLALVPIGRSTWWAGVRQGRFPQPIKLGPRTTCWRQSDIISLIEEASSEPVGQDLPKDATTCV
ncbi:MAG: AlpA family phage regulatory protein [Desulfobacteraceae bacterium]|nr:MAG: AlpA family phage regulatory protein [Desulfobacteraceae bacterium]